jgi:hypothetical protein
MENATVLAIFDKEIRRERERPHKQRQALPYLVQSGVNTRVVIRRAARLYKVPGQIR